MRRAWKQTGIYRAVPCNGYRRYFRFADHDSSAKKEDKNPQDKRQTEYIKKLWRYSRRGKLKRNNIPCDSFKKSELELSELNSKMKEDTVKVLTIHSSKGLENKNVIVIGARTYNDEEKRIAYVAATRAKETLIWMTAKPRGRRKQNDRNFLSFKEF